MASFLYHPLAKKRKKKLQLNIEPITSWDEFKNLYDQWDDLLNRIGNELIFLTHEWFECWWYGFGNKSKPLILLVKDGSKLIGIIPLMIWRDSYRGFPVKKISFIENDNTPRSDFILSEKKKEALGNIIGWLKENRDLWDVIIFNKIPRESETFGILKEVLKENMMIFGIRESFNSPFISIDSDWETYFSQRSKKFRKALRNNLNKLNRSGTLKIEQIKDPEKLEGILPEVFKVSANSWKAKGGRTITDSQEDIRFFLKLSEVASRKGWLNIWLLKLNGKAIAAEYHLKYKGRTHALRGDFDEKYRAFSPGSVLESHIIEKMFKDKVVEHDLGGDPYRYKLKWTSTIRKHAKLEIFKKRVYPSTLYFFEYKVRPFLKRVKII